MVLEPAPNKPLLTWVWGTYLRLALVPVILVALVLGPIYWFGVRLAQQDGIMTVRQLARQQLTRTARQEGQLLQARLEEAARQAGLLARAARRALAEPAGQDRVARTARLDPLMEDLQSLNPLIARLYLTTHDDLSRVWPRVDPLQHAPSLHLADPGLYSPADDRHSPHRETIWSGVHPNPAGRGWMISAVAPIYREDFLEGVVGLDLDLDRLIRPILDLQLPWGGYPLLLDRNDTLLALPAGHQTDWQLAGLIGARPDETLPRPQTFSLHHRPELAELVRALADRPDGQIRFLLDDRPRWMTWSRIPATGWQLLVVVDEAAILAEARGLGRDLTRLGELALWGLGLFFMVTLLLLYWRARRNTRALIRPLLALDALTERIRGGEYYQDVPAFPVRELQDTANRVVTMGRALGDSHQALEEARRELAASEGRYRTVVDHLQEVVFTTDARGNWTFLNPAWEVITGFAVEDSLQRPCLDFIHPEDRARDPALLQSLLDGRQDYCRYRARLLHRDGGHRWVEFQIRGLGSGRGQLAGTTGTLTDVSEHHHTQERLRLAAVVFDNTPLGIVIADGDGRIEGVNSAFSRITGFAAEEVVGRHCRLLLSPCQSPWRTGRIWQRLLNRNHWQGNLLHRHRDGWDYRAWHSITLVRDEKGEVKRVVALIEEPTVAGAIHRSLQGQAGRG